MCGHHSLQEELGITCRTPLRDDSWALTPGFLQILPHKLFPSANFAVHSFLVINHSVVYMLTLPSELRNLGPPTDFVSPGNKICDTSFLFINVHYLSLTPPVRHLSALSLTLHGHTQAPLKISSVEIQQRLCLIKRSGSGSRRITCLDQCESYHRKAAWK